MKATVTHNGHKVTFEAPTARMTEKPHILHGFDTDGRLYAGLGRLDNARLEIDTGTVECLDEE
ncbi:MAG: hypothetical protein HGA87_00035 [Desulfobulbaceae bacterium]|jgi:hypothetical protein|nr:hypothetical protein [Desulfobulbaceae bacterium]